MVASLVVVQDACRSGHVNPKQSLSHTCYCRECTIELHGGDAFASGVMRQIVHTSDSML
jgi:hypothetical protein